MHAPGWGALVFAGDGPRTRVHRAVSRAPLKLLLPRNHGPARWAFAATLGGGLVEGDSIELDVRAETGASALLGTQASTKVFRATARGASQTLRAHVGEGALLCVLPDPLVPFAGARYEQSATYALAPGASLVALDVLSCGRSARGERWAFARYASRTRIDDRVNDAVVLDASEAPPAAAMGRFDVVATLFAVGPRAHVAAELPALGRRAEVVAASSPLAGGGVCLRVAATRIEACLAFLRRALEPVRQSLGDDPFTRKW